MAAAATFPLFSSLPPELRAQIWRVSLPSAVGPVMHLWRKGYWRPRWLKEGEEGFDPDREEFNLCFEYRLDQLDDLRFEVPLLSVNREARDVGFAWVREHGAELRASRYRSYPYLVRPFDIDRDALYVPLDKWRSFLIEPIDRQFEPDLVERSIDLRCDLHRLAIPEALFRDNEAAPLLSELSDYFMNIQSLLVIPDPQPVVPLTDIERPTPGPRLWEFKPTSDGRLLWNRDSESFEFNHESPASESLHKLTADTIHWLCDGLMKNPPSPSVSFEIRFAHLKSSNGFDAS